jgi:REP element-mobilizing transposase RayT
MARPLRLQLAGGIYHVTARGEAGGRIYIDDVDRQYFLRVVARLRSRLACRCLAYCLMGNHYHLVVETERPNLARCMQHLNGAYAQWFNCRHDRPRTHLFQGRYHSVLVQRDAHLLELARYLALNPVKAGLCRRPEEWAWSSHRAMLGLEPAGVASVELMLSYFGEGVAASRLAYAAFVSKLNPADLRAPGPVVAGDSAFVATHLPSAPPSTEIPREAWRAVRPALEQIFAEHEHDEAIASAFREFGYSQREIAEHIGCHYSTVSRRLRNWEDGECGNARPDPL